MYKNLVNYCYCALGAILIAICSLITVPSVVPFTLQTFAVFCVINLLGGKYGTIAVIIYLLLGSIGLPVFSGFSSGLGILFGNTGGYLFGFVLAGIIYLLIMKLPGNRTFLKLTALFTGTVAYYITGTLWFIKVYSGANGSTDLISALSICVLPFILPDIIKLILAYLLSERLRKNLK